MNTLITRDISSFLCVLIQYWKAEKKYSHIRPKTDKITLSFSAQVHESDIGSDQSPIGSWSDPTIRSKPIGSHRIRRKSVSWNHHRIRRTFFCRIPSDNPIGSDGDFVGSDQIRSSESDDSSKTRIPIKSYKILQVPIGSNTGSDGIRSDPVLDSWTWVFKLWNIIHIVQHVFLFIYIWCKYSRFYSVFLDISCH